MYRLFSDEKSKQDTRYTLRCISCCDGMFNLKIAAV